MANTIIAGAVLASVLAFGAASQGAAAAPVAPAGVLVPAGWNAGLHKVHYRCQCAPAWAPREWAPREYWQWDHRPIWQDPWKVLRPTIWGSPEPYLVPADIWACKWHLPAFHPLRHWRWHRPRCRSWR